MKEKDSGDDKLSQEATKSGLIACSYLPLKKCLGEGGRSRVSIVL